MKKIILLCLLAQLSFIAHAEDLQFWNKLPDTAIYYAVGNRNSPPTAANLQKLPPFSPKKEDASKSSIIKVDNSTFPQLLISQEVNGAPGEAAMLYEFKTSTGNPIKSGTKLYMRLVPKGKGSEFTKQTYVLSNISDNDAAYIAGKGSKPVNLPPPAPELAPNTSFAPKAATQAPTSEALKQQIDKILKEAITIGESAPQAPELKAGTTFASKAAIKLPTAEDLRQAERNLKSATTIEEKKAAVQAALEKNVVNTMEEIMKLYEAGAINVFGYIDAMEGLKPAYIRVKNLLDSVSKDFKLFSDKVWAEDMRSILNKVQAIFTQITESKKFKSTSSTQTKNINTINTPQEFVIFASKASPREILGVDASADESTIGKAFRKLSIKFHPDKWPNDNAAATDAYQRIVNARDKLLGKK